MRATFNRYGGVRHGFGAFDLMRDRMYIDTMQQILTSTTKVFVDAKAGSNLLYLPLDQLVRPRSSPASRALR